jgi:hypothetical protein
MLESFEDDAVMSFKNIGISTVYPPRPILSNISGYVKRGGITAGSYIHIIYPPSCFHSSISGVGFHFKVILPLLTLNFVILLHFAPVLLFI